MIGSLAVTRFRNADTALRCGCVCFGITSLAVAATLSVYSEFWIVEATLFVFLLFLGLILPSSTTLALSMERHNSGVASALLGFLMFFLGGILSPMTGIGNMLYATSGIIVGCSIAAWYCCRKTLQQEV